MIDTSNFSIWLRDSQSVFILPRTQLLAKNLNKATLRYPEGTSFKKDEEPLFKINIAHLYRLSELLGISAENIIKQLKT